jgi:hypothetical protein
MRRPDSGPRDPEPLGAVGAEGAVSEGTRRVTAFADGLTVLTGAVSKGTWRLA